MRILIVTHAPLTAEFGASQIALNLGEALRAYGHDVTLWSPQPIPVNTRWWRTLQAMRARLDEFLCTAEGFDLIDCPATFVTPVASRSATVVARSTQPDLLYLRKDLTSRRQRGFKSLASRPFEYLLTLYHITLVVRGWSRAKWILCLGSLELEWMKRWFPWWRGKLFSYVIAPSAEDRQELAEVRKSRVARKDDRLRFLWIGRWVAHKGRRRLLDFITQWNTARPQDTFTIAGCGPDAERDCPIDLLRSGRISIVLSFKRSELGALLARHDAGLFTSSIEGWGLSMSEMLESGMTLFATETGGALDLKEFFNEALLPFPPGSDMLSGITANSLISANYLNEFSWEKIAAKYLQSVCSTLPLTEQQSDSAFVEQIS
jgi:glycosyltransferase involved in cell wall biosynthesis